MRPPPTETFIVFRLQERHADNFVTLMRLFKIVKAMAERVAGYMQAFTLYSSVRPFGASALIALMDSYHGPQLYLAEPSGVCWVNIHCFIIMGDSFDRFERDTLVQPSARDVRWPKRKLKNWI
jgi:hypothetical protein